MGMRCVGDYREDERIAAVVALAIEAYVQGESEDGGKAVTRATRWVAAAKLEARGIPVSDTSLRTGWRVRG